MFVELIYILVSSKITVSHKVSPQTVLSLDTGRTCTRTETFQMRTTWLFVLYLHPLPCYNIPQYSPNRAPRLNSLLCLLRYINTEILSLSLPLERTRYFHVASRNARYTSRAISHHTGDYPELLQSHIILILSSRGPEIKCLTNLLRYPR